MVDIQILERFGCSAKKWEALIKLPARNPLPSTPGPLPVAAPVKTPDEEKRAKLLDRLRSRVTEARLFNTTPKRYGTFSYIDQMWAQTGQQVSPTMLAMLTGNYKTAEDAYNALKAQGYDLESIVERSQTKDAKGNFPVLKINAPAFFHMFVPLMAAYTQARRATLVNQRRLTPMIKFQPVANTEKNRLKAQVITERVDVSAKQFDYVSLMDQATFKMLLYGYGVAFPRENWYVEQQVRAKTSDDSLPKTKTDPADDFPTDTDTKGLEKHVVKEGIRYYVPSPYQLYWDKAFSLRSLNSDTGARYCGYFKVVRYSELKGIKGYYNLDHVHLGAGDWPWMGNVDFWNQFMGGCVLAFPTMPSQAIGLSPGSSIDGKDRDTWLMNNSYYTTQWEDRSVAVYEHYEKIVPADEGLGTYPYPVWARFVMAGNGTVIWAGPLGYCPALVCQEHMDDSKISDSSLALRLCPWQDQMTNLLTQYLLAVKQNLSNLSLVDENIVKEEWLKKIQNLGEKVFRHLNIFPFDSKKLQRGGHDVAKAIYSHRFPPLNTNEILQSMNTIIDVMQRVLGFSSQEIAQAATHEQTKKEIDVIHNSSSNMLQFTGLAVDEFITALGNQQYEAGMNYWEDDFFVSISMATKDVNAKKLEEMGITLLETAVEPGQKFPVKANKKSMLMETFAVVPPLFDRIIDVEAAQAMATFVRDMMNIPQVAAALGTKQAIMIANRIAEMAGIQLPEPIRDTGLKPEPEQKPEEILKAVIDQVLPQIKEGLQPIQEEVMRNKIRLDALTQALQADAPAPTDSTATGPRIEDQSVVGAT